MDMRGFRKLLEATWVTLLFGTYQECMARLGACLRRLFDLFGSVVVGQLRWVTYVSLRNDARGNCHQRLVKVLGFALSCVVLESVLLHSASS